MYDSYTEKVHYRKPFVIDKDVNWFEIRIGAMGASHPSTYRSYWVVAKTENEAIRHLRKKIGGNYQQVKRVIKL